MGKHEYIKWGRWAFAFLLSVSLVVTLTACGNGDSNWKSQKADDAISKAIYEEFGDDIYYLGKTDDSRIDMCYEYLIRVEDAELFNKLVTTVNEVIEQESITDKVSIYCGDEIPGSLTWIVAFSNFSSYELECADYHGLQKMMLKGDELNYMGEDYFYDNPSIYVNVPNIRYMEINKKIQAEAEAQGIDWYECYPDLETFEVYTREN